MPIMHIPPHSLVHGAAPLKPPQKVWYVAPHAGASGGDGSAASPWSAADVFNGTPAKAYIGSKIKAWSNELMTNLPAGNASSPIQPGDCIIMLPGDYGDLKIQGDYSQPAGSQIGFDNFSGVYGDGSEGAPKGHIWVTSQEATTIRSLKLSGGIGWVLAGLRLRADFGSSDNNQALINLANRHKDVVVYGCNLAGAGDPAQWTPEEFLAKAPNGVVDYGGRAPGDPEAPRYITIAGNILRHVGNGIKTSRSCDILIADNDIAWQCFDGIDHGSWGVTIRGNKIHDRIDVGQSYHPDAIQHQPYGSQGSSDNCDDILIEDNTIHIATWPLPYTSVSASSIMQGISQFDGHPTNYRVINNRMVSCATQGISVYGARGVLIEGNSVCLNGIDPKGLFGIAITKSKETTPAEDVTIRGNITHMLGIDKDEYVKNWSASDNLILQQQVGQPAALSYFEGDVKKWIHEPGEYGYATITDQRPEDVFEAFETPMGPYDWRLKSNAGSR